MKPIKQFLTKMAEHHTALAKAHEAFREGMGEDSPAADQFHKAAGNAHASIAEECVQACKTLMGSNKAMGVDDDRDGLLPMPVGLSAIAPDNPNIRPVFRNGMREFGKAAVPEQFAQLIVVDEENDE
jgi:hypothetical protein